MRKNAKIVYETSEYGCQRREETGELMNWSAGGGDNVREFSFETNDRLTDKVTATKAFLKDILNLGYGNTALASFRIKSLEIIEG